MLSIKQQRFVDEFSLDRNASRAARAAGYSATSAKVTACRLLTKANVCAALRLKEAAAEEALNMTRERVLAALQEAFESARRQDQPAAMIAACRAIALMLGYYREAPPAALKANPRGATRDELLAMDDATLAALIVAA